MSSIVDWPSTEKKASNTNKLKRKDYMVISKTDNICWYYIIAINVWKMMIHVIHIMLSLYMVRSSLIFITFGCNFSHSKQNVKYWYTIGSTILHCTFISYLIYYLSWWRKIRHKLCLTHCGLVMPYGVGDLSHRCLRLWLGAWRHQAITWTNVDFHRDHLAFIPE